MEHYKLDTNKRYSEIEPYVEKSYKKLKKEIGRNIFNILKIYGDDDNKYFIAKQIHEDIFRDGILGIDLKHELFLSYFHLMNSLIANEFRTILTLENKVDQLESDLRFYKGIFDSKNK